MPHSGLQSTIQLALHFGGVNATPGFLLNGWRKLFFHFDGMARAQLMNTLSAYCYCAAYYSRYRCTFLLPTLICRRFILTRFTNTADLHSSAASVQCAAITASSSMSLDSSAFLLGICISIVSVSVLLLSADWHCLLEEISHIWVPFTMMTGLFGIAFGCSGMAAPFAQKTLNHLWWWLSVFCPITGRIDKSLSIQSVCTIFCLAHRTQLPK